LSSDLPSRCFSILCSLDERKNLTLEPIPGFMLDSKVNNVQSGELSRLAGVSSDTLRHYERPGVLLKPPRANGGYRNYPAGSLDRLTRAGFSLPELATILKMRGRGEIPCYRVRALAGQRLEEVKQHINDPSPCAINWKGSSMTGIVGSLVLRRERQRGCCIVCRKT
jgi:DNA-binding transcriptional MerR regulator